MELHEALAQISEIRGQIARTETFRGYRSLTVGFSGALALIAAALQTVLIPNPTAQIGDYLTLWISVAVIAVLTAAAELTVRCLRASSRLTLQLTSLAVQQFKKTLDKCPGVPVPAFLALWLGQQFELCLLKLLAARRFSLFHGESCTKRLSLRKSPYSPVEYPFEHFDLTYLIVVMPTRHIQ